MRRAECAFVFAFMGAAFACACGTGSVAGRQDAAVLDGGGRSGDANEVGPTTSLAFPFTLYPAVGSGQIGGNWQATIAGATFTLQQVSAYGDVAQPEQDSVELSFQGGQGGGADPTLRYQPAPPARYSSLGGRVALFQLTGTVVAEGQRSDFLITDAPPGSTVMGVSFDATVTEGKATEVNVRIDVGAVINSIDWAEVEKNNGIRQIDSGYEDINDVRHAVARAFELVPSSGR